MIREDERPLLKLLEQTAAHADRLWSPSVSRFIGTESLSLAHKAANEYGLSMAYDGGWEDAERVQVCFYPEGTEPVYTGCWVRISWNARFSHVRHSDLLGSLMALGIDRSYFGDLIAEEEQGFLYTLPETAVRLPHEWQVAGHFPIHVEQLADPPELHPPEGMLLRDTVPSLRLDCLVASGMKSSRSKSAELIRQGAVSINHREEASTDKQLHPGDLISIRHFGRIRLKECGDPTRKDRLPVLLEVFHRKT